MKTPTIPIASERRTQQYRFHARGFEFGLMIFLLAASAAYGQTFEVLHNFTGGSDGAAPYAGLIDVHGRLYGTTSLGGITALCPGVNSHGCGTVFELTPPAAAGGAWTETVIYRFQGGDDGAVPQEAVTADSAGNLYGTTSAGGLASCPAGCGTVFELQPPAAPGAAWTKTLLYSFRGVPSGNGNGDLATPTGLVVKDGNLFGSAYGGGYCETDETGTYCYGGIYRLSPPSTAGAPWTEHILYRFQPPDWGYGTPVFDQAGNLYTSAGWGQFGFGMIFTLHPPVTDGAPWTGSVVYSFQGGGGSRDDGAFPCDGLVFDDSGRLYGATLGGGLNQPGFGTVFQLRPPDSSGPWTESVLYAFAGGSDGDSPSYGPIIDSAGNLYGTTSQGGDGLGNVFELSAQGQETSLHAFTRSDGIEPSGLLRDKSGNLYGTTQAGGNANFGTVFKLIP